MDGKVHIIIASDNGGSRSLVLRKRRIRTMFISGAAVTLLFVVSLWVAVSTLVHEPARRDNLVALEDTVHHLTVQNQHLLAQVGRQKQENQRLLGDAVQQLNERSAQLESILSNVGVDVQLEQAADADGENSGGPYLACDGEFKQECAAATPEDALLLAQELVEVVKHVPLGVPCEGYLSSSFGRRRDPMNGRRAFHSGVDIAYHTGAKIHATASGKVISVGVVNGYGKMIKIAHGERFVTVFGHLNKIYVKRGAHVNRGDVIGTMGNTGRSTGPHLHYEIREHGKATNPYSFTFL